ncbi:hypothetical protein ES705_37535 [subsurface metagenome]
MNVPGRQNPQGCDEIYPDNGACMGVGADNGGDRPYLATRGKQGGTWIW